MRRHAVLSVLGVSILCHPAFAAEKLNQTPPAGGAVSSYKISPDGSHVVYLGDLTTDGVAELYAVPIDGGSAPITLNQPPVAGGDVAEYRFTTDGSIVVFRGDLDIDQAFEVYSTPVDGSAAPVKINDPPASNESISQMLISPDNSRVVYRGDLNTDGMTEIFSAPIDGGGPQLTLNDPLLSGENVISIFTIAPDASRVVFRADFDTASHIELYSAPIDAAGGQIKLSTGVAASGIVQFATVTSDSTRVVYQGDLDTQNTHELYSAPIDSAGAQTQLNDTPVSGGDVGNFYVSPNGRVVYVGDLTTNEVREIYSVPADGSAPQITLNDPPVSGGNANAPGAFTPDGNRVLYSGDLTTQGVVELYSAPVDGSAPQVKINNTPVAGGNLGSVAVTPDGNRVVYTGDLEIDGVYDLYSAPVDGSSPQVNLLNLSAGAARSFEISPDGDYVVYSFAPDPNGIGGDAPIRELYALDVQGAAAPILLSDPLVSGGEIRDFSVAPDSRTVVYRADQNVPGQYELFVTVIPGSNACPGDINGDQTVNLADLGILLGHYGLTGGAAYDDGDVNGDGAIDLTDLGTLLSTYGTTCP